MMDDLQMLAAWLVRLRYVAYPVIMVCGAGLGIIAVNRMRQFCNGRRALYRALVSIALSLAWLGVTGWLGVVSYERANIPPPAVSMLYSLAAVWLAVSLLWLTVVVVREELRGQAEAGKGNGKVGQGMRRA